MPPIKAELLGKLPSGMSSPGDLLGDSPLGRMGLDIGQGIMIPMAAA
jgi:hypothetical protein